MLPTLDDLTACMRVVSLPLATKFRGIEHREAALFAGPHGWGEWSPFLEYDVVESAAWLSAAIEDAWQERPPAVRDRVPVNATLPAVPAERVEAMLSRYDGCRTVKVKVAERGQVLADDVARVSRVRSLMPDARIRIDANASWNVDEAETALRALEHYDLEYAEQPVASIPELVELRQRIHRLGIPIAADESVRKASDPLEVARLGAADLLVIKVQPLGGIQAALDIVEAAGLPVVVSSALDTSVGISAGAALAAALPELPFDCGLATASLLAADVTHEPRTAVDGAISAARIEPDADLVEAYSASTERQAWWQDRLEACYRIVTTRDPRL